MFLPQNVCISSCTKDKMISLVHMLDLHSAIVTDFPSTRRTRLLLKDGLSVLFEVNLSS